MPMMEVNNPIPDVMENNNAITVVKGELYVGRAGEKIALKHLWSVKKLKWDQEFLRLVFRGLTFHDRVRGCLPNVDFIGYGLCKKTMVRVIYEAAFNDRMRVTTAQETKVPHQVNEGCDPWPVFDENLPVDFGFLVKY